MYRITRALAQVAGLCALVSICFCAAASGELYGNGPGANVTISVINASLANTTFPEHYAITPTPVSVGYSAPGPFSGAPKGEMAAVPRFIGISISPVLLLFGVAVIAVAGAGVWYAVHRKNGGKKRG